MGSSSVSQAVDQPACIAAAMIRANTIQKMAEVDHLR